MENSQLIKKETNNLESEGFEEIRLKKKNCKSEESVTKVNDLTYKKSSKKLKTKMHAIKKLIIVSIISVILLAIEIYGGIYTNSLSILSHSAFMLSEFLVYEISIIAVLMSDIKPSERLSFGYHRSEIIFSMTSVLIIWTVTGILIVEGIHLIKDNVLYEIKSDWMLYYSIFGFVSNIILVNILHIFGHNHKHIFEKEIYEEEKSTRNKKKTLSESLMPSEGKSDNEISESNEYTPKQNANESGFKIVCKKFFHIICDFVQILIVILIAAIIYVFPEFQVLDPSASLLLALIMIIFTFPLISTCVHILMEATPKSVNPSILYDDLMKIDGVREVHDLHVWGLSTDKSAMSAHIKTSLPMTTLKSATLLLNEKYGIRDTTFQIEVEDETTKFDCKSEIH